MTGLISGSGNFRLRDHHDLIAAGRAAGKTCGAIADQLCIERNILTSAKSVEVYCVRNRVPRGVPYSPPRALSEDQAAKAAELRDQGVLVEDVARRFGVSRVTIWKEVRCRARAA